MERVFLRTMPTDGPRPAIRYGATLLMVLTAFLLRLSLGTQLASSPLLLFLPAVFLSALLYGKNAGFLATVVSAALAVAFFIPRSDPFATEHLLLVTLFLIIGAALSAVVEALRQTIVRLQQAEKQKSILLEEVAHRTKNDLTLIASLLTMQARSQTDEATRAAFEAAVGRIHTLARGQERLRLAEQGETIELGSYVEDICAGLGELLRGVRPIAIRVRAERIALSAAQAIPIGLIVNELVTNALKYAFPTDRGGAIDVTLDRAGDDLTLGVSDDGVGCPKNAPEGLGSRLIRLLAGQLNGELTRRMMDGQPGCAVSVRIPLPSTKTRL